LTTLRLDQDEPPTQAHPTKKTLSHFTNFGTKAAKPELIEQMSAALLKACEALQLSGYG
jgi:hypothetical protein